jgi:hypothetical protein
MSEIQRPAQIAAESGNNPLRTIPAVAETGLRSVSEFASAVFAPIGELVSPVVSPLISKLEEIPGVQGITGKINDWAQQNPELAKDAAAVINIVASLLGEKATIKTGKLSTSAQQDIMGALRSTEQSALMDVFDTIKPKLSATEEAAAKASGRGSVEGMGQRVTIDPSPRDLEMARVAQQAGVTKGMRFDKSIAIMKQSIKKSANLVRDGLRKSGAIWNQNELKGVLDKIELPISLSQPDLPIAGKLKQGILKLIDKVNRNPEGILDLRQNFDTLVEDNFGTKIFEKTDPKGILIKKYRTALNDFAESKLPEGKLPDGSSFKAELRRQNLLYDAIENVSETAPKIGESARPLVGKAKRFVKRHQTALKVGGAIAGGAGAVGGAYEAGKALGL